MWSVFKLAARNWLAGPSARVAGLVAVVGGTLLLTAVRGSTHDAGIAPQRAVVPAASGLVYAERKEAKSPDNKSADKKSPGNKSPDNRGRAAAPGENAQSTLLRAAVARLAPQQRGTTDIYAVGIAGWTSLDVFVSEIDGAFAAIGRLLPIQDHTLRLLNNPNTLKSAPLATRDNLVAAIHAVAEVMDKNEDILLLVMSSHGTPAGFAMQLPGGSVQTVTPLELKALLDSEGVKNRVVIVSACYSGIFVPPLANDDTMVLTAADAVSSSFGCAAQREWTYFGDAFFRHGLQSGTDFEHAFQHARSLIRGWESLDRLPPSNPQASFGTALAAKLGPLYRASVQ